MFYDDLRMTVYCSRRSEELERFETIDGAAGMVGHRLMQRRSKKELRKFENFRLTPAFQLNQIWFFAPLRTDCARLRDCRMSWIVSERRAAVSYHNLKPELL